MGEVRSGHCISNCGYEGCKKFIRWVEGRFLVFFGIINRDMPSILIEQGQQGSRKNDDEKEGEWG